LLRGYHVAKRDGDKYRCQVEAAEVMAAEAERLFAGQGERQGSAMQVSHIMSNAIAQLHGVPAARARRTALRHRLIDIQARIPEEMSVFSHQWDIKDVEAKVEEVLAESSLFDQLFMLAAIAASPDPTTLIKEAEESMQQHPLRSLVAGVHYDKDGKTVYRSAAGFGGDPTGSAMRREIAQSESIRRNLIGAMIEMARRTIMARHFLPEALLASIFQQSPFVPAELVATFQPRLFALFPGGLRERNLYPDAATGKLAPAYSENERPRHHDFRRRDADAAGPNHFLAL
jgi:hypothetical protein